MHGAAPAVAEGPAGLEDQLVHQGGERDRAQREVEPAQPQQRQGDDGAHGRGGQRTGEDADRRAVREPTGDHDCADPGEGERRERQVAAVAGQRHQRQGDQRVGQRIPEVERLRVAEQDDGDQPQHRHERDAHPRRLPGRGDRHGHDALDLAHPQLVLGQQHHHEEEEQHRDGGRQAVERTAQRHVALHVGLRQAQHDRADEGEREVLQLAEHGRGVGAHHEQGEVVVVEPDRGDQQDAGQRCQGEADGPGHARQPAGARAVQGQQVGVVDDGPHGHADPGAVEHEEQPDGHDRRQRDREHLVTGDERRPEVHAGAREEPRHRARRRRPDLLRHPDEQHHQPDGGDQRHGDG